MGDTLRTASPRATAKIWGLSVLLAAVLIVGIYVLPTMLAAALAFVAPIAIAAYSVRHLESDDIPMPPPPLTPTLSDDAPLVARWAQERGRRLKAEEALAVAMDEAMSVDRAKSAFLANMSHELRTPLNAIIGFADLIHEDALDEGEEELADDVGKIGMAGRRLLALVSDILDLTRIEAGHAKVHLEEIDVIWFCDQLLEAVRPHAEEGENHVRSNYRGDLGRIVADARKLRQTLLGLLDNACKYTSKGDILLEVERFEESGRPWLRMAVIDTGVGLSEYQQGRVFDAFAQGDDSAERRFGGTGLGLSLSRRLCQIMGGDITVESTVGEGSRFEVRIPIEEQPGMEPAPGRGHFPTVNQTPRSADSLDGTPRALLIGQDAGVRTAITSYLAEDGFETIAAADGAAGIEVARSWQPDVIVIDVLLPELEHWQILKVIKQDPRTAEIPVLMLTISNQRGMALGVRDYLVKPVSGERLNEAVDALGLENKGTILIVEDDAACREVTGRQLQSRGWTIAEAENGRHALEWLAENTPTLVLLDLMMPEVDGFEVLGRMNANATWQSIPVIVLSAIEVPPRLKRGLEGRVVSAVSETGLDTASLAGRVRELLRDVRK